MKRSRDAALRLSASKFHRPPAGASPSMSSPVRRRIIEMLREAEEQGKGAAALDGKMIDAASERMARNVLVMHEAIQQSARPGAGLPN